MIFNAYQNSDKGLFEICTVSAGHIFAKKGRTISRPSGRDDWLLFYVIKGLEEFQLDKTEVAREGSFIIFQPHEKQIHTCIDEHGGEYYYIHFTASDIFTTVFETSRIYHTELNASICSIFEDIINELHQKKYAYEKVCISKLMEILSLLERECSSASLPDNKYIDKISFVIHTMNKEYNKDYTLDDFAKMCNMSKYYFSRIFKDITGVPPLEYRNSIRIEHAKNLLENTSVSIGEIAEKLGYTSQNYFCDTFRKHTGKTPSEYRYK